MWHWLGEQIRVPTPGSNQTRSLFGALNIRTGRWTYLVCEHMHKEDFIAFLEHILAVYTSGPIILIVDNYSSHTAKLVGDWLAEHPRLQLYYLPLRSIARISIRSKTSGCGSKIALPPIAYTAR